MSVSYDFYWTGRLYDPEKQKIVISELNQLAQIYNDIYFGEEKDETTLCFFDHVTLTGQIQISSELLNNTENYSAEEHFPLIGVPGAYSFRCSEVKLYGLQFLIKGDPVDIRTEKSNLETLSYVFWGFNSTNEEIPFVKSNIARIIKHANDRYELVCPGVSFRLLKPWFAALLYEYFKEYYFEQLDYDNPMGYENTKRSNTDELMNNDLEVNNEIEKQEAFNELLESIKHIAQIDYELDEIEIKDRMRNPPIDDYE